MWALPDAATAADLDALRAAPHTWRPSVDRLARSLGLAGDLADLGGSNLIVAVDDHVLKLAPPAFAFEIAAELEALRHVQGRLPLPTPAAVDAGEHDGWSWILLTRLRGTPLYPAWPRLDVAARTHLLEQLGELLRALHGLPPPPGPDGWAAHLAREELACLDRQRRWGVPESILAGIPAALARGRHVPAAAPLLHADLHGKNVLVDDDLRITGVVDFGDSLRGDPVYDLVTPALLLAGPDRHLQHALIEASGLAFAPHLRERLLACAVLHRFNDLTRYTRWGPAGSLDELAGMMFPA